MEVVPFVNWQVGSTPVEIVIAVGAPTIDETVASQLPVDCVGVVLQVPSFAQRV